MSGEVTKQTAFNLFQQGQLAEAERQCDLLRKENPRDAEVWCVLSMIESGRQAYPEAKKSALRALKIDQGYVEAKYYAALAQYHLKETGGAIMKLEQVISNQPGHGLAHLMLGKCLEESGADKSKIIEAYDNALSLINPPKDEIVLEIAKAYNRFGQASRAIACLERMLASSENHEARRLMAEIHASSGNLSVARNQLENLISRHSEISDYELAAIYNRLGLILDQQGEYAKAYEAIAKSQRLDELASPQFNANFWFDRIEENRKITRSDVIGWLERSASGSVNSPVFLVGFPRSGTSLTERILASHPGLVGSGEAGIVQKTMLHMKKITSPDLTYREKLNGLSIKQIKSLQKKYWENASELCRSDAKEKKLIDKLPLNLIDISFIHRIFPDAPILFLLRDPRDVCLSCFMQIFEPNEAMVNFYSMGRTAKFYDEVMNLWQYYKKILDMNIHVLRYEDLVEDLEREMRKVASFLDISWEDAMLNYYKNNKHKVTTPSVYDTAKPIFTRSVGRWKNYRVHIDEVAGYLEKHIEEFGYS